MATIFDLTGFGGAEVGDKTIQNQPESLKQLGK